MTDILTSSEIQSLQRHLEFGNLDVGSYPHTHDGFLSLFVDVISPNLSTGPETTATTAIAADEVTVVTPVAMASIVVNARLVVDVGDDAEIVVVKSLPSPSTFSARFKKEHPATGYPIAVQSGLAELRMLLHRADLAREKIGGADLLDTAGIKIVDKGDVEFFGSGAALTDVHAAYGAVVAQIALLVRLKPLVGDVGRGRRAVRTEAF